jgi:hypothetical protein
MGANGAPRMTSLEKVRAALAMLDDVDAAAVPPETQAILLAVTLARGKILASLPDDPAQLDQLLLYGAAWAVKLRSDDAEPFELARGVAHEPTEELEPVRDGGGPS